MNVDDWYTLTTANEVVTGTIVEVNKSFFRIKQGDRTRAYTFEHVVALEPVLNKTIRPERHSLPI